MRTSTRAIAAATVAFAATGALAACSTSDDVEDTAGSGDGPQRVVLSSFAAANVLDDLELEDRVVGITKSSQLPAALETYASDDYQDIGTLPEVDMAKVAELAPDFAVLGRRTAAMESEFTQISQNVQVFTETGTNLLADNRESVLALAEPFGEQAVSEAEDKLDSLDDKAADIKSRAADAGTALVIMTSGGKVTAFGPGSGFNVIYNELGFKPATEIDGDAAKDPHGAPMSWEQIADINPDYVFVIDRDAAIGQEGEAAEALLDNDVFKSTTAAREGHVQYLTAGNWYLVNGGLSVVDEMLDEVGAVLDN